MRRIVSSFLLSCLFHLPAVALAHDNTAPLAGEDAFTPPTVYEQLLRALMPDAEASATITVDGNYRLIQGNGYPDYTPGNFPNAHNPNAIRKKNYQLRVPLNPVMGAPRATVRTPFGIALNGVLFDPGTAEYWRNDRNSGWNYEALGGACQLGLDFSNAHVQPNGAYHYHGLPTGLLDKYAYRNSQALLGYAADGFPIYGPYGFRKADDPASGMTPLKPGYRVKSGTRPSGPGGVYDGVFVQDWTYDKELGDLDECNGRVGVTPEYPDGTYYYVISGEYPFIPRCWRGTPDSSFAALKGGPGGRPPGAGGNRQPGGPPPQGGMGGRPPMGGAPCQGS